MNSVGRNSSERYNGIDGLRACAALGIVAMHVLKNGSYYLDGFVFERLIPSFTDFVFLFMMISSFSMCCGYYERIVQCRITPNEFYVRRYSKVWPFFALLTILDILVYPSKQSIVEGFANLTLCFGLLPNSNISVIGVGWTLGVIFVFYLLFPFFTFLLSSPKRGWLILGITLLLNTVCDLYFFDETHVVKSFSGRSNILYSAVYFVAGGMVYLYKDKILQAFRVRFRWMLLLFVFGSAAWYFMMERNCITLVTLYSAVLIFSLCDGSKKSLLNNRLMKYISTIGMEIYLSHMFIFRVIEKLGWLHLSSSEFLSYCAAFVLTAGGSMAFSTLVGWGIIQIQQQLSLKGFSK